MPVSTGSFGEPRAKRCKFCDESNHRNESGCGYWQLQLDRDLIDTISAIYPEWFRQNMADSGGGSSRNAQRETSPKAVVDTSPIRIDQNKESLKVKLMLRRPLDQLVDQGIMPPHKTPAAYHGQRRQLERAKTGDMLKAKIQQRPSRQELERRHILESDPGHLDPSLVERQRMLKKARLADQLNDQLSHRPGPLELIHKNILHTEEPIEQAVKTGKISYKATSEGQLKRPQHPSSYITPEDDSQSSEGDLVVSPGPSDVLENAAKSAGIVVSLIPSNDGNILLSNKDCVFQTDCVPLISRASPSSITSSSLSPLSSIASPGLISQPSTPIPPPLPSIVTKTTLPPTNITKTDAPGKDKNRKKSKSKSIPKTRTIKFHEYKGPPSAHKNNNNTNFSGESSYDLLLQQQTLLLQFQLQLQHKYPQFILPANQEIQNDANSSSNPQASPAPSTSSESSSNRLISTRLEDMKVSDLKAELKRRSLPVSGSKPLLIERLKLFGTNQNGELNENFEMQQQNTSSSPNSPEDSVKDEQHQEMMEINEPISPNPKLIDEIVQQTRDDIVKEQQKRIEELQRELTLSQLKLQAATRTETKAQVIALQKHLQAKQQQQTSLQIKQLQELQEKQQKMNEEQQKIQQEQHEAFQNQKNGLILNGIDATLVLNQILQGKVKLNNNRMNGIPNFFPIEIKNENLMEVVKPQVEMIKPKVEVVKPHVEVSIEGEKQQMEGVVKLSPLQNYQDKTKKQHVKSQIIDDVLEILIKNGELPPSAAQDPITPTSEIIKNTEPIYTSENQQNIENLVLDSSELLDSLDGVDLSQFVMELSNNQQQLTNGCDNNNSNDTNNSIIPMDTDEWLESLCNSEVRNNNNNIDNLTNQMNVQDIDLSGYDPLLGYTTQNDPFDPFNLDEFRCTSSDLTWDKLDYAT